VAVEHDSKAPSGAISAPESFPKDRKEIAEFLNRAQNGDTSTLPALRKLFENAETVNNFGGNLAAQVEASLVTAAAGNNLVFKHALLRKLDLLRVELGGPNPTPLERLLVERIVTCWLHLHDIEARFVQAKERSIAQADYGQRALDRAQKRYLSALRTLATVRRLAVPVLQVNIANRQKNIAGANGDA
jgi:hypothetical protein